MQTSKWGPYAWYCNHKLPMCFPEILTDEQAETIVEYFEILQFILPCKYCRASYEGFIKEFPPREFILNPDPRLLYPPKSRLAVAKWLEIIHDKVNTKLEKIKPFNFLSTCCSCEQESVEKFCESLWNFLFTIIWNYIDEDWRRESLKKFFLLLRKILKNCIVGSEIDKSFQENPLLDQYFESLDSMKRWIYTVRKGSENVCGDTPTFEEINEKYESWRSGTCNEKQKISKDKISRNKGTC